MSTPIFTPEQLGPIFPEFGGFRHITSGGFKSVYRISRANGGPDEVLKIVRLPVGTESEEAAAIRDQELGRVQRETAVLGGCTSPFVVKLGRFSPRMVGIDATCCYAYTEELCRAATWLP